MAWETELVCEVCGAPISRAQWTPGKPSDAVLCRSFDCQRLIAQRDTMDPLLYPSHYAFQRRRIRERRAADVQKNRHEANVRRQEAEDNQRIFAAVLDRQPEWAARRIELVMLPSGPQELQATAPERIAKYRAHLEDVIARAGEYANADAMPQDQHFNARDRLLKSDQRLRQHPALKALSDRMCGQCKGGCCTQGDDHAFLTPITIRRFLDADPSLTADALLQRYLDLVPDRGVAGGCINQTQTDCAVPREWRSDVCNGFYCDSLRDFQNHWIQEAVPDRVLVIQRANHQWNRFDAATANAVVNIMWMDDSGVEPVTLTPVPPDSMSADP